MTRPVPDTWEPITDRPEGGWVAPGQCGGRHLVGAGWVWWQCPTCMSLTRFRSTRAITEAQMQMLARFYPDKDPHQ